MKMTTMKLNIAYYKLEALINVLEKFTPITGTLAAAIARTKSKLNRELRILMGERDKLIKKYGVYDEEKQTYYIEPNSDGMEQFKAEFDPILNTEIEVDIYQISQEEFDKTDIFVIPDCNVNDYEILEDLFVERGDIKAGD